MHGLCPANVHTGAGPQCRPLRDAAAPSDTLTTLVSLYRASHILLVKVSGLFSEPVLSTELEVSGYH